MTSPALNTDLSADERSALLSALADGDASALSSGCALWRDDPAARSTWHAYHLIGDVLRSQDLAAAPGRDAAFLAGVRARLAQEPVVLAPRPRSSLKRVGWHVPAAAAAGFVAAAGLVGIMRLSTPAATPGPALMASDGAIVPARVQSGSSMQALDAKYIRDARLDMYLMAHRRATGSFALPGGTPRNVETFSPALADSPMVPVVAPVSR